MVPDDVCEAHCVPASLPPLVDHDSLNEELIIGVEPKANEPDFRFVEEQNRVAVCAVAFDDPDRDSRAVWFTLTKPPGSDPPDAHRTFHLRTGPKWFGLMPSFW
jgi:hypothetical protein